MEWKTLFCFPSRLLAELFVRSVRARMRHPLRERRDGWPCRLRSLEIGCCRVTCVFQRNVSSSSGFHTSVRDVRHDCRNSPDCTACEHKNRVTYAIRIFPARQTLRKNLGTGQGMHRTYEELATNDESSSAPVCPFCLRADLLVRSVRARMLTPAPHAKEWVAVSYLYWNSDVVELRVFSNGTYRQRMGFTRH